MGNIFVSSFYLISGDDINWSLTAFATPDPAYRWFNPKGYLIDFDLPQTKMKYDLDVDDSTHRITLTIKHLQLSDIGHYILEILVNEGSFQVKVKPRPSNFLFGFLTHCQHHKNFNL